MLACSSRYGAKERKKKEKKKKKKKESTRLRRMKLRVVEQLVSRDNGRLGTDITSASARKFASGSLSQTRRDVNRRRCLAETS